MPLSICLVVVCGGYCLLSRMLDCAAIEQHTLDGGIEVIKEISTLAISTSHAGRVSGTAVIQYEVDVLNCR